MIRVRFAPSPTGFIHIGNARTALFNFLYARHMKGQFLLRIEDTDRERSKPEYETALKEDLAWLGISWDETPVRQSDRTALYKKALERFIENGDAYPCFCSQATLETKRKSALEAKLPPRYDGACRSIPREEAERRIKNGEPFTYRFKIRTPLVEFNDLIKGPISIDLDQMVGDFIIARQDASPTFHLAVCVDDVEMKITHVIRGEDHLSNTPRHILLFRALGAPLPQFAHMPLILGEGGQPLSKRLGDFSMKEFRSQGYPPSGVMNYLALLGWAPGDDREILTPQELIELFTIERVNTSPARFNADKMRWVLHAHFQKIPDAEILEKTQSYLHSDCSRFYDEEGLLKRLVFLKDGAATFKELADKFDMIFARVEPEVADNETRIMLKDPGFAEVIRILKTKVESETGSCLSEVSVYLDLLKPLGLKGPKLFKPLRLALTGSFHGPELKLLMGLLPRPLALERIAKLEELMKGN